MKFTMFMILLATTLSFASQVEVKNQAFIHSRGYYSNIEANFIISFQDETIPYGVKVFIEYGFSGKGVNYNFQDPDKITDWNFKNTQEMKAISPWRWSANIWQVIANRSSPVNLMAIDFVFHIYFPNGLQRYEKGSQTTYGFFYSPINDARTYDFVSPDNYPIMPVKVIERY